MDKDIKISSREEEEAIIVSYILENTDISEDEAKELAKNLDIKTIESFEEALENVAKEHDREKSKAELLYTYIREENKKEKIVSLSSLKEVKPFGFTEDDIDELIDNIEAYEELDNINIIESEKDLYFYDIILWTGQYANTAVILEEGNILEAVANRVRTDCKIYPRPLQISVLEKPPYSYTSEEISGAISRLENSEEYSDIKTVTASNGGVCLYSTLHMSEKYAQALCEELEVEWKLNQ